MSDNRHNSDKYTKKRKGFKTNFEKAEVYNIEIPIINNDKHCTWYKVNNAIQTF